MTSNGHNTVFLLSSVIFLIFSCTIKAQQLKTVLVGEAAEFSCSLKESLPPGDISWQIQWDDSARPVNINAETTGAVSGPEFTSSHGDFRTVYESERGFKFTHHATIIVEDAQLSDAGQYNCKHDGTFRDRGTFSMHELRVLPRPPDGESPICSHRVLAGSSTAASVGDTIELTCEFTGGDPPARLVWYKLGQQIGNIRTDSNVVQYRLQPSDNGMEFNCHAMSPALSETSYCHVTPFNIQPSVSLTPSEARTRIGGETIFTCTGEGIPSISAFKWRIDGVVQNERTGVAIILTDLSLSRSELRLENLQIGDNGKNIMCEVAVESGLTADALATIVIVPDVVSTVPPVTERVSTDTRPISVTIPQAAAITASQSPVLTTQQLAKTSGFKSTGSSKMTTRMKRVEIGGPKVKSDQANSSSPATKTNTPMIATVIGILCLLVLIVIIVVVARRRNKHKNGHNVLQPVPSTPTDSFPDTMRNPMIEYSNRMYEGTIISSTPPNKTPENFYQTLPLDGHEEDPEQTWSPGVGQRESVDGHEGCGAWAESKNHHYENTAIGRPFPTFARHQEPEHFLYDHVEKQGDNTI